MLERRDSRNGGANREDHDAQRDHCKQSGEHVRRLDGGPCGPLARYVTAGYLGCVADDVEGHELCVARMEADPDIPGKRR